MGKSTTANKLLGRSEGTSSIVRFHSTGNKLLGTSEGTPSIIRFPIEALPVLKGPDGPIPNSCAVLANKEWKVRVLDTPFGSCVNEGTSPKSIFAEMLDTCRSILHVQGLLQMTVKRVVYFLPIRGPLEKIGGAFHEELKGMYHFFGPSIFENMVVVTTNHRRNQKFGFFEDDKMDTRRALHVALKLVTGDENIFCPPIVYIAIKDTGKEILDSLQAA